MKAIARSLVVVFVALIAVPALAVSYTIATAVQLLATTALIMGGTGHPLGPPDDNTFVSMYMSQAVNNFIVPAGAGPVDNRVAVITPEQFFPVSGTTRSTIRLPRVSETSIVASGVGLASITLPSVLPTSTDNNFIVFGYSQSAVIASLVKRDLIENPGTDVGDAPDSATFFLIANPMRPNGGILARGFQGTTIPLIGITFYGPAPTNSPLIQGANTPDDPSDDVYQYQTVDVAQQYDFLGGDAPARPLNVLAMANSIAAYVLLHGNVPNHRHRRTDGMIDQGHVRRHPVLPDHV